MPCLYSLIIIRSNSSAAALLGASKANGVLAKVIDGVVAAEESIAEDDEGTSGGGDVHTLEGRDAAARDLEDVVRGRERILGTSEAKGDVGKRALLGAVDGVLAIVALLGSDLLVQKLGQGAGEDVEGRAGVKDDTSVLELGNLVAKGNGIKVHLPVGLAAEGDVLDLALVTVLVDATEDSLALALGVGEVESENGLVQETLVDHLVEGRDDAVDGDGVVGQTKDAIKAAKGKSKAGFAGGLGKVLILDLEVTDGENIVGYEASQATRAVMDLEVGSVGLVRRGGVGVVR